MKLVDKTGRVIKVGDHLRTPEGDVVEVQGSLGVRRTLKAKDCEIVSKRTPLSSITLPVIEEILWG